LSQRFGIDKGDIAEYPEILTIFPTTIENHIMLLEEGGFSGVTANDLLRYILMCFLILIESQCDIGDSKSSSQNKCS
jgi:hypothetical protein